MNGWYVYTLNSKYLCNKSQTIPYFIIFISNRVNFAVRGPNFFGYMSKIVFFHKMLQVLPQNWIIGIDCIDDFVHREMNLNRLAIGIKQIERMPRVRVSVAL